MSYNPKILHFANSSEYIGSMDPTDPDVGTSLIGAPACGDVLKFYLRIQNGRVVDVRYKTFGCGSALAASGCAAELLVGMTIEEAASVTDRQIIELLDLPPIKYHCSCLTESAISAAIADYKQKQGLGAAPAEEPIQCVPIGAGCASPSTTQSRPVTLESLAPPGSMFGITETAVQFLKRTGESQVLLSTQSHGCLGTSYQVSLVGDDCADYYCLSVDGVEIYVHPAAEMFVVGITVDYEQRNDWEGLVFINPNERGKCRCGESFYT